MNVDSSIRIEAPKIPEGIKSVDDFGGSKTVKRKISEHFKFDSSHFEIVMKAGKALLG